MKVYISVDIEGVTGTTDWNETELGHHEHTRAVQQMQAEAAAACRGAVKAGATEIWIKDSHDSARNLWFTDLPKEAKLVRGWLSSPYSMVAGGDKTFDACAFIGYHSPGGVDGNPLAHTMSNTQITYFKLNGKIMSELDMHSLACAKYGVPAVFVSGDQMLCDLAKENIPGIGTVPTKIGIGAGTVNNNPEEVCKAIEEGMYKALTEKKAKALEQPKELVLDICFANHFEAKRASYYKGAEQIDAHTVRYKADDIHDMLCAIMFMR